MSSGYSGEFMYGLVGGGGSGAGRGNGTVRPPTMGGLQGGVMYGSRAQQQQQQSQFQQFQQLQQQQQQQQVPGMMLQDQIKPRRVDPLMGKRSFGDYQSYQQQIQILQQQQQQRESPVSYIQRFQQQQQQQLQFQNQNQNLLLRSVKQRLNNNNNNNINGFNPTIDLCSPTNNNNNNININNNNNNNNNNNSLARFGVPVYQQPRQQQIPFNQTYTQTQFNPTFSNNNSSQILNPGQNVGFASGVGYSNPVGPVQNKPESDSGVVPKMMNTLQDLEKHLLYDDDEYNNFGSKDQDGDAVSGITNSEWSEAFENLISPDPAPTPNPVPSPIQNPSQSLSPSLCPSPNTVQLPCNNNNNNNVAATTTNNNNNVISPSPTSSTSSCCSTSAPGNGSPPTAAVTTTAAVTISAKQLISEVATAISDGKNDTAMELLSKLGQMANYEGNSEERLAYYMCNALKSRACPSENPTPVMELFGSDQMSSVYSLFDISPCFKFGLLAANLVMLEAITSAMQEGLKVHVIDFDVGHGAQYVNLLRALADRKRLAFTGIRITVVETELGNQGGVPESVRDSLVGLAERVGINLNYLGLNRSIRDLSWESLGCEDGEAVVVNFAFKLYRVPDESVSMENLRDELLRRVKGLSPRAVTLVEQDMNGNTAPFGTRVNEVCEYYGALFDSLEATLPRDNPDRCRVEKGLGRKMVNSVACEGRERVERAEVFGKWRARMGMAGFELKALGQTVAESMRAKLNSARGGNPGFTVKDVNGGVGFGWKDRSLTVASAWR